MTTIEKTAAVAHIKEARERIGGDRSRWQAGGATLAAVVAENIRAVTHARGWSQGELGAALGMAPVTVGDRFRQRTPWTLDELERVAEALDIEVADLVRALVPPRRRSQSEGWEFESLRARSAWVLAA